VGAYTAARARGFPRNSAKITRASISTFAQCLCYWGDPPPPPSDATAIGGPRLLRLVSYEGIDGVSMFPGADGVVRAMREVAL
jgi:hypothetical protein